MLQDHEREVLWGQPAHESFECGEASCGGADTDDGGSGPDEQLRQESRPVVPAITRGFMRFAKTFRNRQVDDRHGVSRWKHRSEPRRPKQSACDEKSGRNVPTAGQLSWNSSVRRGPLWLENGRAPQNGRAAPKMAPRHLLRRSAGWCGVRRSVADAPGIAATRCREARFQKLHFGRGDLPGSRSPSEANSSARALSRHGSDRPARHLLHVRQPRARQTAPGRESNDRCPVVSAGFPSLRSRDC